MNTTLLDALTHPAIREVDAAVREVLARLVTPRANHRTLGAIGGRGIERGVVTFTDRLLSLRSLESLGTGLRAIEVAPGTVITPLARDQLRRLAIEVRLASRGEVDAARRMGEWGFVVEVESGLGDAARRLLLEGSESWRDVATSVDDLAGWVAASEGRGGLVLTDEASLAVYRACRVPGVRAAAAAEPQAVSRAIRALGLNLLVVEIHGTSLPLLRQVAATFRRGGAPQVPPGLD